MLNRSLHVALSCQGPVWPLHALLLMGSSVVAPCTRLPRSFPRLSFQVHQCRYALQIAAAWSRRSVWTNSACLFVQDNKASLQSIRALQTHSAMPQRKHDSLHVALPHRSPLASCKISKGNLSTFQHDGNTHMLLLAC